MIKAEKIKLYLIASLTLIIVLTFFSSSMFAGEDDTFSEIQQKMVKLSDDEKEILQNLFVLVQEIEVMENKEKEFAREIEIIKQEIKKIELKIACEEAVYEKKLDVLKQVLKSYQRKGPGSYLEIILSSENLTMFLRRINALRDLTRGTGELLESLDESKKNMAYEKAELNEKLVLIEDKQKQLKESLDIKLRLKADMEAYLASLKEEREHYEEYLDNIQQMWDELKPLLADTTQAFSSIIEDGSLSLDSIKMKFSTFGIKGMIDQKTFNDIISQHPLLSEMEISFEPGKMTMNLPKENLVLTGNFVVLENNVLKFEVEEGSFYGMSIEPSSLKELFEEDYLMLNLKPLLGDNTLSSVEIEEENIILTIKPKLF